MVARGTTLADPRPPAAPPAELGPLGAVWTEAERRLDAAPDETRAPRLAGVVAEYASADELLAACERVRDAGMTRWDSFTPYPVHGVERAMGIKPTVLPWLSLAGGLTGCATGVLMQWYMNGSEELANAVGIPTALQGYNYLISGKPIWSLPANIPVSFELTILFSAFGAFFGMLALNRLPRLSNPRLRMPGFRRGTDDRFLIGLDAKDPKFDLDGAAELLAPTRPASVAEVWDVEPRRPPAWIPTVALILFALLLIPPALIAEHRNTPWTTPRIHPVGDMDWQAKFKPQERNTFFADERAMRPQVPNTIARGELELDDAFFQGIAEPTPAVALGDGPDERLARAALFAFASLRQDEGGGGPGDGAEPDGAAGTGASPTDAPQATDPAAGGSAAAGEEGGEAEPNWTEGLPIDPTLANVRRGQLVFNIYCAACHGVGGYGNGLVNQRAEQLQQGTWVRPSNLHDAVTRARPNGFLFDAITNGVRKMPAYASQIEPADRWRVVLYVRALQKSQHAELAAIPPELRDAVREEARAAKAAAAAGLPAPEAVAEERTGADAAIVPRGKAGDAPETSSMAAPMATDGAVPDRDDGEGPDADDSPDTGGDEAEVPGDGAP